MCTLVHTWRVPVVAPWSAIDVHGTTRVIPDVLIRRPFLVLITTQVSPALDELQRKRPTVIDLPYWRARPPNPIGSGIMIFLLS